MHNAFLLGGNNHICNIVTELITVVVFKNMNLICVRICQNSKLSLKLKCVPPCLPDAPLQANALPRCLAR